MKGRRRAAPANSVDPPASKGETKSAPSSSKSAPYQNLRRLPGYSLGDVVRPEDATLCDPEEATAAVANRLRPHDCAFVLRSDGAFTYALHEGLWEEDESSLLFRLDDEGKFKIVANDELLCARVKIPVLPMALARNATGRASERGEAEANIQGTKAPRRSSMKCNHEVQHSQRTEDLRQTKSLQKLTMAIAGRHRNRLSAESTALRTVKSQPFSTGDPMDIESESFSVGDVIPRERMPRANRSEMKLAVSCLKVNDTAFVKRSCGKSYSYSAVTHRDSESITFRVTAAGNTKKFPLSRAGDYVIIVGERKAEDFGTAANAAARARDEMSEDGHETHGESTVSSHPPAYLPVSLLPPHCLPTPREESQIHRPSASRAGEAGDRNNAHRFDSKLSSSTSVTSLCSIVSDGSETFLDSDRGVRGDAVDAGRGTSAGAGPPGSPSPVPSPPRRRAAEGDGGTRPVVAHEAGTRVLYRGASGPTEARILAAHYDDLLEPYYTIELACGREKQTDEAHLVAMVQ